MNLEPLERRELLSLYAVSVVSGAGRHGSAGLQTQGDIHVKSIFDTDGDGIAYVDASDRASAVAAALEGTATVDATNYTRLSISKRQVYNYTFGSTEAFKIAPGVEADPVKKIKGKDALIKFDDLYAANTQLDWNDHYWDVHVSEVAVKITGPTTLYANSDDDNIDWNQDESSSTNFNDEDDIVPFDIALVNFNGSGTITLTVDGGANVRMWTDADRTTQVYDTSWQVGAQPGEIWVEGVQPGTTTLNVALTPDGSSNPITGQASLTVSANPTQEAQVTPPTITDTTSTSNLTIIPYKGAAVGAFKCPATPTSVNVTQLNAAIDLAEKKLAEFYNAVAAVGQTSAGLDTGGDAVIDAKQADKALALFDQYIQLKNRATNMARVFTQSLYWWEWLYSSTSTTLMREQGLPGGIPGLKLNHDQLKSQIDANQALGQAFGEAGERIKLYEEIAVWTDRTVQVISLSTGVVVLVQNTAKVAANKGIQIALTKALVSTASSLGVGLVSQQILDRLHLSPEMRTSIDIGLRTLALWQTLRAAGLDKIAPNFKKLIMPEIKQAQAIQRGWNNEMIAEVVTNPFRMSKTRFDGTPLRNRATGNLVTAFIDSSNNAVLVDDVTGVIVQISDRLDPNWMPEWK